MYFCISIFYLCQKRLRILPSGWRTPSSQSCSIWPSVNPRWHIRSGQDAPSFGQTRSDSKQTLFAALLSRIFVGIINMFFLFSLYLHCLLIAVQRPLWGKIAKTNRSELLFEFAIFSFALLMYLLQYKCLEALIFPQRSLRKDSKNK